MDGEKSQNPDAPRNCQSCDRPDTAESEMVQCSACKLWEHFGCAGVDGSVKQPDIRYVCGKCMAKQGPSTGGALQVPRDDKTKKKVAKGSSRTTSKRGKTAADPPKSVSSSIREKLLDEELKLVAEEQRLQEEALHEQEDIRRRQLAEEERRLEEKRRLAQEESEMRGRKLQEELELKRKKMQIRKESLEKRQALIREAALTSSRSGSVQNSSEKVKQWLDLQNGVGGSKGELGDDGNGQRQPANHDPLENPVDPAFEYPDIRALSVVPDLPRFPNASAQMMQNPLRRSSRQSADHDPREHPADPAFQYPGIGALPVGPDFPRFPNAPSQLTQNPLRRSLTIRPPVHTGLSSSATSNSPQQPVDTQKRRI
ncbi:uncharacterized protein LOC134205972 [Armigeres subalbatus]|uniref:uncharacterized protein LOC134205972 n=1 Tax=Armigeres subalbatus TaxID=124917 RepID=UPI002ED473C0